MSRDTPAPDAAAELLPCPFCGSYAVDPTGWMSLDRRGPYCDACGATADSVEAWNRRDAPRFAPSYPLAMADAIRGAKVEALEEAAAVARANFEECQGRGSWQDGLRSMAADIETAIRRLITASAIPPSAAISSAADGIGSRAEERCRAPMTLGSSDALAVMEMMGKALENALALARLKFGNTDHAAAAAFEEADDALAAFRAWRAGGGHAGREEAGDGG